MKEKELKLTAVVNESFEINHEDLLKSIDLVEEGEGQFHILSEGKKYQVKVLNVDFPKKQFLLSVNGSSYPVTLKDSFDQLVQKLGLTVASNQRVNDVKAPMPGLVLDVSVKIGQEIEKGESLLILEAMKMENIIKSQGEGVVKAIHIKEGAAVEKGQLLIEME